MTGNGFSLVHQTFGLFFCGSGPGGDGLCSFSDPNKNSTDVTFSYLANISDNNYQSACDFTRALPCNSNIAHPEWTDSVKQSALDEYTAAFASLPVIVQMRYAPTTINNSQNAPFDHTVYVSGAWLTGTAQLPNCPYGGKTADTGWSRTYYLSIMCAAQFNLGSYGNSNYFQPQITDANGMLKLLAAIGRGIGRDAAHETGHQFAFPSNKFPLHGLECGTGGKDCENDIDAVYEFFTVSRPWFFQGGNSIIRWETSDCGDLERNFLNTNLANTGCP